MVLGGVGCLVSVFRPQSLASPLGAVEGLRAAECLARHGSFADADLESQGRGQARSGIPPFRRDSIYAQFRSTSGLHRAFLGDRWNYSEWRRRLFCLWGQCLGSGWDWCLP